MKDYTTQIDAIRDASTEVATSAQASVQTTVELAKALWQLAVIVYTFARLMVTDVKAYYNASAVKPLVSAGAAKVNKQTTKAFNHVKEYAATAPSIAEVKGWVVSAIEKAQDEVKTQMGSPE